MGWRGWGFSQFNRNHCGRMLLVVWTNRVTPFLPLGQCFSAYAHTSQPENPPTPSPPIGRPFFWHWETIWWQIFHNNRLFIKIYEFEQQLSVCLSVCHPVSFLFFFFSSFSSSTTLILSSFLTFSFTHFLPHIVSISWI